MRNRRGGEGERENEIVGERKRDMIMSDMTLLIIPYLLFELFESHWCWIPTQMESTTEDKHAAESCEESSYLP